MKNIGDIVQKMLNRKVNFYPYSNPLEFTFAN